MHEKITLPNGVRLLFEDIPHVASATVGIWVACGSRYEPARLSGVSHALEHMVFKGTENRSAARIASDTDAIGGQFNAFTTKECTCFYIRSLTEHLPVAIDVLTDVFFRPLLAASDWETERGVILEEIGMFEDSPEDLVTERLFGAVFKGCQLGRPILGSAGALKRLSAGQISRYKSENYNSGGIVVALSGQFSASDRESLLRQFASLPATSAVVPQPARMTPSFTVRRKAIEQNHFCMAWSALPYGSPDRYTQQVLSGILGGGMSSRLMQEVRESRGLCYSIYSFATSHEDAGLFGIYTAVSRETEKTALPLISKVVSDFLRDGPSEDEVVRAREQAKANVLMSLESTSSRMTFLGRNELLLGETKSPQEVVSALNAVSRESICDLARQIFVPDSLSFSAIGRVSGAPEYKNLLSS